MVKRLFIATIVAISPLLAFAQNVISGHISDVRTGEPLIGATVIVKNEKTQGVVTDYDGNFTLQTKVQAPLTLRVEYVGYRPLDVDVYDFEEPVQIALADNSNSLNEVVVVGYGVQKRKSLTGSVTTVKNEKLLQLLLHQVSLVQLSTSAYVVATPSTVVMSLSTLLMVYLSITMQHQPILVTHSLVRTSILWRQSIRQTLSLSKYSRMFLLLPSMVHVVPTV